MVRRQDVDALLGLSVAPEQQRFVASNSVTLAQAAYNPSSTVCGVWKDDTPIGLVAWVDTSHPEAELDPEDEPDCLYLWRLMIGHQWQRRGFGREILAQLERRARVQQRSFLYVSAVEGPGSPLAFYEKAGFRRTGAISDGEVVLRLPL